MTLETSLLCRMGRSTVSTLRRHRSRGYHVHRAPEPQDVEISGLLAAYAAHPPHPITLSSLVAFGQPLTPESLLRSGSYVLAEIPRRLARRARVLEKLPFIVGTNPYVAKTLKAYRDSFQFLATYPRVTTLDENAKFTAELSQLVESHRNDIPTMAKGY
ncbi:branched-chain alpha-ketoacid dehydrogenase kinase [Pisolithus marmoratus]|nr:branched-chain alpha-ketoacid dehydrogenase kinase [Pisolithus marmoratus]